MDNYAADAPIANPDEVDFLENHGGPEGPLWLMWAGAYANNRVWVWATNLGDAFEVMAEYFDDEGMHGIFTCIGVDELKEAAEELGYSAADIREMVKIHGWDDEIIEHAEMDLTIVGHTMLKACSDGMAYIPSWEWGGNEVSEGSKEWATVVERSYAESED